MHPEVGPSLETLEATNETVHEIVAAASHLVQDAPLQQSPNGPTRSKTFWCSETPGVEEYITVDQFPQEMHNGARVLGINRKTSLKSPITDYSPGNTQYMFRYYEDGMLMQKFVYWPLDSHSNDSIRYFEEQQKRSNAFSEERWLELDTVYEDEGQRVLRLLQGARPVHTVTLSHIVVGYSGFVGASYGGYIGYRLGAQHEETSTATTTGSTSIQDTQAKELGAVGGALNGAIVASLAAAALCKRYKKK